MKLVPEKPEMLMKHLQVLWQFSVPEHSIPKMPLGHSDMKKLNGKHCLFY